MRTKKILPLTLIILFGIIISFSSFEQKTGDEPWKENQLMPLAELAAIINNPGIKQPVIFSIGPGAIVKGSIDIGAAKEKGNLKNLKLKLSKLPKNTWIVIYCGCCPFRDCPNIRPAFSLLNKMKFTQHQLLNLPKNIKADWIDKGYPKAIKS
ncbi:MAG TPA: hypothetical protein VI548_10650 [Chitinophagaceae bacterium]|nr:hypothetical protein [Chitinophagaceae bacterium]